MKSAQVLILPGWQNSGPAHWQSLWIEHHHYTRVEQHDWMRPLRGDWVARLEDCLIDLKDDRKHDRGEPVVLVAHSLGCLLAAAWAAHSRHTGRVKGALLVAPPDTESEALRHVLPSWSPIPLQPLPFATVVVASRDDPYCAFERAQQFAGHWGAQFIDQGACGHINAESGLGDWPAGHALLQNLMAR